MRREIIAKKLREARERFGLSQQELASLMGWKSHSSLVAIEKGEQDVKTWELLKFAEILKVAPESLYREEPETVSEAPILFWRMRASDEKAVKQEELNILEHCHDYRLLERLTGIGPSSVKKLPHEECDIEKVNTDWANQLATKIHREFNLGDYPAELLAKCLEEDYDVLLISRSLDNGSAACLRADFCTAIVLNEKEVPWRQTFNLAHELFHLITWSKELFDKVKSDSNLFQKNEKFADAFAAALLMPQPMIEIDVQGNRLTYAFIVALARKYSVSTEALLWRLCHLRFLAGNLVKETLEDEEFKRLDRLTPKKTYKTSQVLGNRFLRLSYLAYESGRLSKGRLAQMLGKKFRDVDEYLQENGFYLTNDKEIEESSC